MKIQRLSLVLCLCALGACTVQEGSSSEVSAQPKAPAQEQTLLAPADAAIPTPEEAAAAAAKAIDASNADAELEKLKKEIEGGH